MLVLANSRGGITVYFIFDENNALCVLFITPNSTQNCKSI